MKKLYVIGIGPGEAEGLTGEARTSLAVSDVIVGYKVYTDLIRDIYPEKEYVESGMRKEVERCREALRIADEGHVVSVISSGDPGVYGMASLVAELSEEFPEVSVTMVSGVSACLSGAARLGAPIGHDFCVISLSDALTPWEVIEKRLRAAAEGDFCICIYNPESRTRSGYLARACEILLTIKSKDTVCGYVRNIGRDGEETCVLTLGELQSTHVDMFTTVFVGNSMTKKIGERMVTPRGYQS